MPCPRPSPSLGPCGTSTAIEPASNRGVCMSDFCSCNDGWADPSCGTPIINLTDRVHTFDLLDLPGRTWQYYVVTVSQDLGL